MLELRYWSRGFAVGRAIACRVLVTRERRANPKPLVVGPCSFPGNRAAQASFAVVWAPGIESSPLAYGKLTFKDEAMGPPGAQVVTAIGETVNACARLERLTRRYDCPVIVSRRAAEAAGLAVGRKRHRVRVDGGAQIIEFYALETLADLRA